MATARDLAIRLCVALIVAAGAALPAPSARADCNPIDLANQAVNAIGSLTSPACLAATADDGGSVASYVVAGGLEGASAVNSGAVNDFCNSLNQAQDDLNKLQAGLNALNAGIDLSSVLGPLNPFNIVECACNIQQGVNSFVNDLGQCVCDAFSWVPGVHCGCSNPPPPKLADCALPSNCFTGSSDPACQTGNAILGCIQTNFGGQSVQLCPGQAQPTSGGTYVSEQTGDPNCPQTLYCFCPLPLVPVWTTPPAGNGFDPNPVGVFTCECPSGTYQATSKSGQPLTSAGVPVCLCDYTNQPPKIGSDPSQMCNINILGQPCPNGQTRLGNKCVTPCTDPTKGMTMDGACCDPTQMSSCGQCCPPGTTPNPISGSCMPQQVTQ
jgi:hypothetical protein